MKGRTRSYARPNSRTQGVQPCASSSSAVRARSDPRSRGTSRRTPRVTAIGITGRRRDALDRVKAWVGSEKITAHVVDIHDRAGMLAVMRGYDAGALALPDRKTSYRIVARRRSRSRLPIVDMLEEYHRTPGRLRDRGARAARRDDARRVRRLAPRAGGRRTASASSTAWASRRGCRNITIGEGIRKLDRAATWRSPRVGGIPREVGRRERPLRYMITWAFDHVLREYMIRLLGPSRTARSSRWTPARDREPFLFDQFGQGRGARVRHHARACRASSTSRPQLREFAEKTVRWPGHWDGVQTLKECGLLDLEPGRGRRDRVVPREFLLALIVPRLRAGSRRLATSASCTTPSAA